MLFSRGLALGMGVLRMAGVWIDVIFLAWFSPWEVKLIRVSNVKNDVKIDVIYKLNYFHECYFANFLKFKINLPC